MNIGRDTVRRIVKEMRHGAKEVIVTRKEWEALCEYLEENPDNPDPYYHVAEGYRTLVAKVVIKDSV